MNWLIGGGGFVAGFVLGQVLLLWLLRDKTRRELLADKSLHWTFGLLNWIMAALGAVIALMVAKAFSGH